LLFQKDARSLKPLWASVQIGSGTNRKKIFPNQAPVSLALALAFKLFSTAAHPPAAFWAYPIQNPGNDICGRFDTAQPNEGHYLPRQSQVVALRFAHRITEECISASKMKRVSGQKWFG
jgi:hypothetical protein